jgi:APA family basic amino acid/polyamine antiporter
MPLRRVLGPVDAAWLVAGNMIGAGIFATPGLVAGSMRGALWCLLAWALGGLLALAGASVYGELGARLPRAGGDYQYLRAAFGPVPAFLTGWAAFVLTFSASAAAMTLAALAHLEHALPLLGELPVWGLRAVGILVVLAFTAVNAAGARLGGRTTAVLTAIPLAGLLLLFGLGLLLGDAQVSLPARPLEAPSSSWVLALGAAMVPVFFTYSGWNAAAYVAGEVRDAGRNLPRALLLGTGAVTFLYLLVNLVILVVVPYEELTSAGQEGEGVALTAGARAARILVGETGEVALSALIALAMLGSANVTLMAGARVYYAMARDGLGPSAFAGVNRAGVPATALWAGGLWASLLVLSGTFERLVSWSTLAMLLLSSLTVASLLVLRRRDPGGSPFRCPGYPLTPVLYMAASLGVAVSAAFYDPRAALIGILLVAAGLPLYPLLARRGRGT